MFSEELITVINKYRDDVWSYTIEDINLNIKQLIKSLKNMRNILSDKLYEINTSDTLEDENCGEILSDIYVLKQQILYLM